MVEEAAADSELRRAIELIAAVEVATWENRLVDLRVTEPMIVVAPRHRLNTDTLLRLKRLSCAPFTLLPAEIAVEQFRKQRVREPLSSNALIYDEIHGVGYRVVADDTRSVPLEELNEALRSRELVEWVYFNCHGEGGHLKLRNLTVCGLVGAEDMDVIGRPIPLACSTNACRRSLGEGGTFLARDLHAHHLIVVTCNGLVLSGEGFPSLSSVCVAALEGTAATVTSSCAPVPINAIASVVLSNATSQKMTWWEREELLNRISAGLLGLRPFLTIGIPNDFRFCSWRQELDLNEANCKFVARSCRLYRHASEARRRTLGRRLRVQMTTVSALEGFPQLLRNVLGRGRQPKLKSVPGAGAIERILTDLLGRQEFGRIRDRCDRCGSQLYCQLRRAHLTRLVRIQQLLCPVCGVVTTELLAVGATRRRGRSTRIAQSVVKHRSPQLSWRSCELSLKAGAGIVWREENIKRQRVRLKWPPRSPSEIDTVRVVLTKKGFIRVERHRAVRIVHV